jgi:hypothetical protein
MTRITILARTWSRQRGRFVHAVQTPGPPPSLYSRRVLSSLQGSNCKLQFFRVSGIRCNSKWWSAVT